MVERAGESRLRRLGIGGKRAAVVKSHDMRASERLSERCHQQFQNDEVLHNNLHNNLLYLESIR